MSSDAMNLCLSLITQGYEDTAFSVLKSFTGLQVDSQNSDSPDLGNFFLRHCVNMDKVRNACAKPSLEHDRFSVTFFALVCLK